jgi:hypothetical protein
MTDKRAMSPAEIAEALGYDDVNHVNGKIANEGGLDYWLNDYQGFDAIPDGTDLREALDAYFDARATLYGLLDDYGINGDEDYED